jgi:predicted amidophosphoribosyltransferase
VQVCGGNLLSHLVDSLLPDACPGCGELRGAHATGLCWVCRSALSGLPRYAPTPWPLAGGWSLGRHGGPLGAAIRRGKYRPDPLLVDALGSMLAEAAHGRLPRVDAVVPVPVHTVRRLKRGFDQGERLARPVAAALGVPLDRRLWRIRRGDQAALGEGARLRSARGAFRAADGAPDRVLLIDDVRTTGATAAACATELLGAGARSVLLLTLTSVEMVAR